MKQHPLPPKAHVFESLEGNVALVVRCESEVVFKATVDYVYTRDFIGKEGELLWVQIIFADYSRDR